MKRPVRMYGSRLVNNKIKIKKAFFKPEKLKLIFYM